MTMDRSLSLTMEQHTTLKEHLFPGDGKEAVALVLCGQWHGDGRVRFLARTLLPVPHKDCSVRTPVRVTWSTDLLASALEEASRESLILLKVHSHPTGLAAFSPTDDRADQDLFAAVQDWGGRKDPFLSAVMLPDGTIFGRACLGHGETQSLARVTVVGDQIEIWPCRGPEAPFPEFAKPHAKAFGARTTQLLGKLRVGVVGCSGTGSPVVEQLARLGVGSLVLVDPDRVEERNLNRILHSTMRDTREKTLKVEVLGRAVGEIGLGTEVVPIPLGLHEPEAIRAIAGCDVVFGCMDGYEGRYILNRISNYYSLPYFDLGVKIEATPEGEIRLVVGSVHYLQPGRSSLLSRQVITLDQVNADHIRRNDPGQYEAWKRAKYIQGVDEERPGVISLNMQTASLAVTELLARLHPFRDEPNGNWATVTLCNSQMCLVPEPEGQPCGIFGPWVGRGDTLPLLGKAQFGGELKCSA